MVIDEKTKIPLVSAVGALVFSVSIIFWIENRFAKVEELHRVRMDQDALHMDIKQVLEDVAYIRGKMERRGH